jgi:NADH dehydrogenase [ubiquinone] 1 alpha subcomplex assembly factor 7
MVEVSEVLAQIQAEKLCSSIDETDSDSVYYKRGKTKNDVSVYWYKDFLNTRPKGFTLTVAHEFFDALPIHKLRVITVSVYMCP